MKNCTLANAIEALTYALKEAIQTTNRLWRCMIECYPDRRVAHLALHHKKERVRKKNARRIERYIAQSTKK